MLSRLGFLVPATIAMLLAAGQPSRADLVHWSYNWEPSTSLLLADSPGTGKMSLSDEPLNHVTGSSDTVATNLHVFSTAPPTAPDRFTGRNYSLNLAITDDASHQSGTLTFNGVFNGTFSSGHASIQNQFTGPTLQTLNLGGNRYIVTMGTYTPPGPPSATNAGSISANVFVNESPPGPGPAPTPEPPSVLLACLGLSFAGLAFRWKAGGPRP
jgi:hypothetical protein